MKRELKPCGTWAAYQRHRAHGEEACRPCKDAANARNPKADPREPAPCGTRAGGERHRQAGEPKCKRCLAAEAEYMRAYRSRTGVTGNEARDRRKAEARERKTAFSAALAEVLAGAKAPA